MRTRRGNLAISAVALCVVIAATTQCSNQPKPTPAPETPAAAPALLGDMTPVVSVRELMSGMIDPIADNIFDSVRWNSDSTGFHETKPTTDEDWEKVRIGAVTIVEGIYLLKVPRPITPEGDLNNSTGPNPPELSPTQIKAKIDKDPVLWNAKIQALRNVGLETLEAVKKKDVEALFQASTDLDEACESCHLQYWYPGDKGSVDQFNKSRAYFEKETDKPVPVEPAKK